MIVFNQLITNFDIQNIYSYQESGIQKTFDRDIALKKLFNQNSINWKEFQRDGIVRGLKNRKDWDKLWFTQMHQPIVTNTYATKEKISYLNPFLLDSVLLEKLNDYPATFQPAGEKNAFRYLQSFIDERGINYSKHISKPMDSRKSCGRLSPYLAWGNLSIRQAYQHTLHSIKDTKNKRPYQNFLTRLKWHCHFIQKFEFGCLLNFQAYSDVVPSVRSICKKHQRTSSKVQQDRLQPIPRLMYKVKKKNKIV